MSASTTSSSSSGAGSVLAPVQSMEWRQLGPFRGGRVSAVVGHPTEKGTFFFGGCAGGVWKSTDGGAYWRNVSDGYFNTAAVGSIAIAESDPNVIYVGTGETNIRGNVSYGDGVYKSTDGGRTWQHCGLAETQAIGRIRVHPKNPDIVYAAAFGHQWGPNEERGVYRSTDGGKTWEKVLYRSDKAGAVDLTMDPNNPRVLFASTWEAQRYPHHLNSGGPGSGIFRTTDGGDSWTEVSRNPGMPEGVLGKIGIAVSPAQAGRVYAIVEAVDGALFRSDDNGDTWQRLCEEGDLRRRAWYYQHMYADPQDPDTCWVLNLRCWKSTDGGKTFSSIPTPHGDNQDLWIDPHDSNRMIEGNDGGACVTFNGALTWSTLYNQPTAQFYHVTTDDKVPYRLYGSQQDNTALSTPSSSVWGAVTETEIWQPGGGESGYIAVKPDNQNIIIGGSVGSGAGDGRLIYFDARTFETRVITPWPEVTGMGRGAEDYKYRFQWTFPIIFSQHNPDELYVTSQYVHRSTNLGHSWEVISPDLTRNDPSKLGASGGPITKDNTGAELYCTIFAFAESPHQAGVFWAGSDDGLIHRSDDGGKTWNNVTPPSSVLPEWALISIIEVSPHDPNTVYVAATRYKSDDFTPYLLKTTDNGQSWTKITEGIPANEFTRTIREDPSRKGLLYAGTETGVYVSLDDGQHWERFQLNLPVVPIHDLMVKGTDLLAATHGRSFWVLDDLTPLHQLQDGVSTNGMHLFTPREVKRIKILGRTPAAEGPYATYGRAGGIVATYVATPKPNGTQDVTFLDAGKNPPSGAVINYYLKEKPADDQEVTLTFLDAAGNEIRTYSSKGNGNGNGGPKVPAEAGANRFVWDLHYPDAVALPSLQSGSPLAGLAAGALAGPEATPGNYQVKLKAGDSEQTASFTITRDPRVAGSDADLQAQFTLLIKIRDKISQDHEAVKQIHSLRDQIDGWASRAKDGSLNQSADALKEKLSAIEKELIQPEATSPLSKPSGPNERLSALSGMVASADVRPTVQMGEAYDKLSAEVNSGLDKLSNFIEEELMAFNEQVKRLGIAAVVA